MTVPDIAHRFIDVGGVKVFYRETSVENAPTLLLLHGFPSGSHQFRRLLDELGDRYRLIAPDYPGFGHTDAPHDFVYSFEALTDVVEGFVQQLGLERFFLYTFDFGGPIGLRLATRHPEWIAGLIVQNANAYEEGLSELARSTISATVEALEPLFTAPVTRGQYEGGTSNPESVSPDGWTLDQHFLDLPGRKDAQVALALDYQSNVALYSAWQEWLREHRPPALIVWGRNDAFFTVGGAEAYRQDLPDAEIHLFDTGHFALEEKLAEIVPLIDRFLRRNTMDIAIIGATGHLGGAIAQEAASRGHRVTRLSRPEVDVRDAASIRAAVAGHTAVVAAVKGPDRLVPKAATALIEAEVDRLLFVGGGASLLGPDGSRFIDSPNFPDEYLETATDQGEALEILRRTGSGLEWSYLSPPPMYLVPGERTGAHVAEARDTPITDADGQSQITVADFAVAAVDALEKRLFIRERFTVGYRERPERVPAAGRH